MSKNGKTISEINEKLQKGKAVVMTAMEFKKEVRSGYKFKVSDVDVVTTGTRGVMSGTSAMLVIPLGEKGRSARAERLFLNGVPCIPVCNPEEDSELVDAVIYGTTESWDHHGRYGGGHVLRDLVEGREVEVECLTTEGRTVYSRITLEQIKFARLYNFRNDFQNYVAFSNIRNIKSYRLNPASIFSCRPIPLLKGITASGSGELNPLENDPHRTVLKSGMKILLNGSPGVIIGYGTRSTPAKKALFVAGDMFSMDPQYMGGFKTSYGVEVTNGIAVPFPITDEKTLDGLSRCLDENIPLPVADLADRTALRNLTYADIWAGAKLEVEFDPDRCICCSFQCPAEYYCPMGAISWKDKRIDEDLCVACGACTANCMGGAFKGKGDLPRGSLGSVSIFDRNVPIIFRQSNRYRAERIATYLKELMERGDFLLTDSDIELTLRSK
jgi:putative methanogenesis marker 16 metalloprotein